MSRTSSTVYTSTYTVDDAPSGSGTIVLSHGTDLAGNVVTSTPTGGTGTFDVDNTAPTITGVSLESNNTEIAVTFSEAVFNSNSGSGSLQESDFVFSLSSSSNGGDATLSSTTPSSIDIDGNVYTLGISLSGTPDGSETLTVKHASSCILERYAIAPDSARSPMPSSA